MIKIDVVGLKEAKRFARRKEQKVTVEEQKGITNAAIFMQGEVKLSIAGERPELKSVDTGHFLNSVDVSFSTGEAIVFTEVPYGPFLEYGTSKFHARKHFQNSKFRNEQKVMQIVQKAINKI